MPLAQRQTPDGTDCHPIASLFGALARGSLSLIEQLMVVAERDLTRFQLGPVLIIIENLSSGQQSLTLALSPFELLFLSISYVVNVRGPASEIIIISVTVWILVHLLSPTTAATSTSPATSQTE